MTRPTHNHDDKQDGGDPRSDVEHDSDVVAQLIQIIHIRHKYGRNQEPDGNAQLKQTRRKPSQTRLLIKLLWTKYSVCLFKV